MGNHTAGESCYQAFMKIFQIARCTVTCRNDVVIIVSNRVESVENFHTGRFFRTIEKLNIINK